MDPVFHPVAHSVLQRWDGRWASDEHTTPAYEVIFQQRTVWNRRVLVFPAYRLYTVVPKLVKFVDMLTNWYVRTNRRRLKVGEIWLIHSQVNHKISQSCFIFINVILGLIVTCMKTIIMAKEHRSIKNIYLSSLNVFNWTIYKKRKKEGEKERKEEEKKKGLKKWKNEGKVLWATFYENIWTKALVFVLLCLYTFEWCFKCKVELV